MTTPPKQHAWSYSALTSFETCPKRHYLTRVSKEVVEPETDALRWGNNVHKALELRATEGKPLPVGMTQWEPIVARLLAKHEEQGGELLVERQIALNAKLQETEWFAKDVWVRGVVDVGLTKPGNTQVLALDYKTGKQKHDMDQLRLFAALLMHTFPDADIVHTGYVWLKTRKTTRERFHRDDLGSLWGEFIPRVNRLEQAYNENKWPAKPSGLCRAWCPCTSCEHNGRYGR